MTVETKKANSQCYLIPKILQFSLINGTTVRRYDKILEFIFNHFNHMDWASLSIYIIRTQKAEQKWVQDK